MAAIEKNTPTSDLLARIRNLQQEVDNLKEENAFHQKIIALIPGNVYWKNTEGVYLGCNNNIARLIGLKSPADIIGKTNKDVIPVEFINPIDEIDQEVIRSGTEKYIEETGYNDKAEKAIYLSKKIPLWDQHGKTIGLLGVSFDITERKKIEEDLKIAKEKAEASDHAKTQFLAVVNHELRTPLASIMGLVSFLKQGDLSAKEEASMLDAIDNCTQHLLNLVNEVLDFSRLETGTHNIRFEAIHINDLLQEVYGITQPLARKKNIELSIHAKNKIPKRIISDVRFFRQILINLVSNAIKFTEVGKVTIELNNLAHNTEGVDLEFTIIDTGQGIPNDKLNIIFEPFLQLEDAYTRQSSRSGTGLGLAIVDKLAQLVGAKIHVVSQPGKGSSFTLRGLFKIPKEDHDAFICPKILPNEEIKPSITKTISDKINKPTKTLFPMKQPSVLLIEDDPIVQFVHKKMLTDLGCIVNTYSHGKDAIENLSNEDIIFVDISLPDISGFEVIRTIRQAYQDKQTPIVALTAYTGKEERLASLEAGANVFSTKPISQNYLKRLLLKYLKPKNVAV